MERIVLNAYFRMGHDPGGFRVWWRALTGSDATLENTYLMRMAGRFSRRVRGYAKAHGIPVIDCSAGQRKHDLAEEYLAKTTVTQGLFLILVGRAQAPVWDVNAKHPVGLVKLGAMNVFIVRTHQSGFADRLEIARPVADDMADNRDARLSGQCPIVGVRGGVQL